MRSPRAVGRRLTSAAVVAALAAAALAGCSEGSEVALGTVEATDPGSGPPEGGTVSVTVPTGTLEITVAEPAEEVGDQRAADDGGLLRLTTSFHDAEVRSDVWAFAGRRDLAEPVTLALGVGEERYDVGVVRRPLDDDTDLAPADAVVAVPGDVGLDDVRLLVGYDGLEQSVSAADGTREPGPADALYEPAQRGRSVDCDDGRFRPDLDATLRCRAGEARLLPYLPGPGWAADGRAWLVTSLGVEVSGVRGDGAEYAVDSVTDRTTYRGAQPAAVYDETTTPLAHSSQLAFDVAADPVDGGRPLSVVLDLRLRLAGGDPPPGGGPDRLRYAATPTLPAPRPLRDEENHG